LSVTYGPRSSGTDRLEQDVDVTCAFLSGNLRIASLRDGLLRRALLPGHDENVPPRKRLDVVVRAVGRGHVKEIPEQRSVPRELSHAAAGAR